MVNTFNGLMGYTNGYKHYYGIYQWLMMVNNWFKTFMGYTNG